MKNSITLLLLLACAVAAAQNPVDTINKKTDSAKKLNEVLIKGQMQRLIKTAPGNLSVIDARPYYNNNISPVQLLRGTAGIKVKQDGGYGSRVDFFINGSTGKQLKFFLDGLPLDNLGETIGINNVPIEQLERIEIYKGIIPAEFGADVLGGAINMVTRKEKNSYVDVSYAISSFNTNKVNFSARKKWSNHFYTSLMAFGGYSKNNYKIEVANITINNQLDTINVKRFHDRYQNYIVNMETGLTNLRWADLLSLVVSQSLSDKQLQNNLTMSQPYAKANYKEKLYRALVNYQKNNVFKNFNLTANLSLSRVNGLLLDTSKNIITWDQQVADRRLRGAELGPQTKRNTYTNAINQKIVGVYWLNNLHKITLSNTWQYYRRTAKDTLAQRLNNGLDLYGTPSSQFKNVAGLEYNGALLDGKLKISTAVKNFDVKMNGYYVNFDKQFKETQHNNYIGYNTAFAYQLLKVLTLKASYEHAVRLPDVEEAFGDLILINPNPSLKAEESDNFNLNALYFSDQLDVELTGFYRNVNHLIFFVPNSQGSAKAYNLLKANVNGAEFSFNYRIGPKLALNGNVTYQDLRNQSYIEDAGIPNERYKGERIPNIPYLLTNVGINYQSNNILTKGDKMKFWYGANFTKEYFLYWKKDGDLTQKNIIPSQFLHNAGISYALNQFSFSVESYNLTNAKTFDNFKSQLPGRSLSFKTRYYISK